MLSLLYLLQNCPKWRHNSRTCLWWGQKETNCSSDKTWILTQVRLHRVLLQEVNKQIIWQRYCPGDSFKYVINMSENPVCFNTLVFSTNQALQSPENSTDLWLTPSTLFWCWMDCQKSVGTTKRNCFLCQDRQINEYLWLPALNQFTLRVQHKVIKIRLFAGEVLLAEKLPSITNEPENK